MSVLFIYRKVTIALLVIVTVCEHVCPEAVDTIGGVIKHFGSLSTPS